MFIQPTGTAMPVSGMGISLQNLFFGAHRVFYGGAVDHTPPLWLQPSPPSAVGTPGFLLSGVNVCPGSHPTCAVCRPAVLACRAQGLGCVRSLPAWGFAPRGMWG